MTGKRRLAAALVVLALGCAWGAPALGLSPAEMDDIMRAFREMMGRPPPRWAYYGAHRSVYSAYKTWPEAGQQRYVGWVVEGIWSAYRATGSHWETGPGSLSAALSSCGAEPAAAWASLPGSSLPDPLPPFAMMRYRVLRRHAEACRESRKDAWNLAPTSYAVYQEWPEPDRIRYVDAVMEGIEVTFEETYRQWPEKLRDVFEPCTLDLPKLSGMLAKLAAGQDGKHPMPKLIFTAYETACREQKGK